MRFSEMTLEELLALSWEEKWNIVCGNIRDDGKSGQVALLLGSNPEDAICRAHAAARLYHAGRVEHIVSSGGVEQEYRGKKITEADLMAEILRADGVPENAIIPDNEAKTTRENMICGTLAMERALTFKHIDHVIIVTSQSHMQRSLALAKAFLPRKVTVSGYPWIPEETREQWLASEKNRQGLDHAIRLTKRLVDTNITENILC